jgi:hypothetical protein
MACSMHAITVLLVLLLALSRGPAQYVLPSRSGMHPMRSDACIRPTCPPDEVVSLKSDSLKALDADFGKALAEIVAEGGFEGKKASLSLQKSLSPPHPSSPFASPAHSTAALTKPLYPPLPLCPFPESRDPSPRWSGWALRPLPMPGMSAWSAWAREPS